MQETDPHLGINMMTPTIGMTPAHQMIGTGPSSEYGQMTPGSVMSQLDVCAFSPAIISGDPANYASPGFASPSPYYGSPAYGSALKAGSG